MLLYITKSIMVLAMLFLFSCSKDSTSIDDTNTVQYTSGSMTLLGEMSGNIEMSRISRNINVSESKSIISIIGLINSSDIVTIEVVMPAKTIYLQINNNTTNKIYSGFVSSTNIRYDENGGLTGTFSGVISDFSDKNNKITVTNGKFYIL